MIVVDTWERHFDKGAIQKRANKKAVEFVIRTISFEDRRVMFSLADVLGA